MTSLSGILCHPTYFRSLFLPPKKIENRTLPYNFLKVYKKSRQFICFLKVM